MSRTNGASIYLYPGDAAVARQRRSLTAQERCDAMQAEVRGAPGDRIRRGPPGPPPLALSSELLDRRIAEEIDYAKRLLEAMGDQLVGDALVLARHGTTLQGFDKLAQTLGHLATVVGAADRAAAVDRIGAADLRGRIQRQTLRATSFVAA